MASAAARKKTSAGMSDKTSDIILVAICAIALIIVAYPLYYVLVASISDPYDVYAGKTFLLPSGFTLDGYKAVFADPKIVSGFLNSVKYTVIGTCFSVIMLYITAYPLADKNLPGRKWISLFFVFTMYFGGGLVPTYLVVQDTGLIGSMWSLFLPGGVAVGNMIIVRNNTKAEEDRKPQDSLHDHPVNERPLFVKLTAAFHKRNGYTDKTPIGCHMIVSYDEKGNPSFSRLDAAGDSILQANGYQFKASSSMDKWTNTYLVKHKTGTDADGKDIFILRLKYRNGKILIPEYTAETAAAYVRPSEEELERNE